MKGFLLGVILTATVGGFFYHLHSRYATWDACAAVEDNLTDGVKNSLGQQIQEKTGSRVVGQVADALLAPVTDPMIAEEVAKETLNKNWFQCTVDLIKLDLLNHRSARIEAIKKRLPLP